jgi:hypothetical protein
MNNIKGIRINVSTINGESILCEMHLIVFGPGGLLRVPERIGFVADDLLCFPIEEDYKILQTRELHYSLYARPFG